MSYEKIIASDFFKFFSSNTKQKQVFEVLSDEQMHCRPCDFKSIDIDQIAGGGGIQGLERGTKTRPGLEIHSKQEKCSKCNQRTMHDRWTGRARFNAVAGDLPDKLKKRIAKLYNHQDPLTGTTLKEANSIVDHRFARERWGTNYEPPMDLKASDDDLLRHYQILRFTKDNNENLRKSRACEICKRTGIRQSPINKVKFFYKGNEKWPSEVPNEGIEAMEGCVGCGWFDTIKWLDALNQKTLLPCTK